MKRTKILVLAILIIFSTYISEIHSQEFDSLQVCKQDSVLRDINLMLVEIWTNDSKEPTGTNITAPEGLWGVSLIDNEYVYGRMRISLKDKLVYDSENNGIRIRLRGNTSSGGVKKPYKLKLSKKADLLFRDIPKEDKDWVLQRIYPVLTMIVNTGLNVGLQVGLEWEPECKVVNLVINGEYKGDYLLIETVKRDKHRIDIDKTGYLIEDDAYWWNEDVYFKGNTLINQVGYTFKYPDSEDLNDSIIQNIKNYILDFEEALKENRDVSEYIDIDNWAAWLLAQDILGQTDAGGTNRFIYKEDYNPIKPNSTLLKMGPLWDFDCTFVVKDKWSNIHRTEYSFFYGRLLKREDFFTSYITLWENIKGNILEEMTYYFKYIFNNKEEDINKSRILNKEIYPDETYTPIEDEIKTTIDWLYDRINWISLQLEKETFIDTVDDDSIKECKIYNIYGQKISQNSILSKGIYIINGKKVLIK